MILITGAGGLLGANLAADILRRGVEVTAAGHGCLPAFEGVQAVRCDLTAIDNIVSLFARSRPSCVIHCAAATSVDSCESDPKYAWRVNMEMSRHLASQAAATGARFVYISTDSVFDGNRGNYTETDQPTPINVYARTKLAGEAAVREASPGALVVRTNIYGWNMQPKLSLAEWMLGRLESGLETPGFSDVVFCPILVNDLGDAILEMIEKGLTGLYHVAGSEACSKLDFAMEVARVFGRDPALVRPASVESARLRAPRPKNTSLCVSTISRVLGRSMPSLNAGLERFKTLRANGFEAYLKHAGRE